MILRDFGRCKIENANINSFVSCPWEEVRNGDKNVHGKPGELEG